jgi:hypothetical protein
VVRVDREALAVVLASERVLALAVLLVPVDSALALAVRHLPVRHHVRSGLLVRRVVVDASSIRRRRKAR